MCKLYYWYVKLNLSEALVVLDEFGSIYYLSLGKWNSLVDIARREFRQVRGFELLPGKQEIKTDKIDKVLQNIPSILEDPRKTNELRDLLKLEFIFGTKLQKLVWEFLVGEVQSGETITYSEIARRLGRPGAARQIGQACGANKIAVLVPCHRVISVLGNHTGYKWGLSLKRSLLSLEKQVAQT